MERWPLCKNFIWLNSFTPIFTRKKIVYGFNRLTASEHEQKKGGGHIASAGHIALKVVLYVMGVSDDFCV